MSGVRLQLHSPEDAMELGAMLARALASQNGSPLVRVVYLFGGLGSGKTTLTRGFAAALPGGENAEVASPSFTLCNVYPTRPVVLHADLYRLGEGASLPEEMDEAADGTEDGAILVLEWPEYLPEAQRAQERLDVLLEPWPPGGAPVEYSVPLENLDIPVQPCERKRSARVTARGEAAARLLKGLRADLESRFPVQFDSV